METTNGVPSMEGPNKYLKLIGKEVIFFDRYWKVIDVIYNFFENKCQITLERGSHIIHVWSDELDEFLGNEENKNEQNSN